jgi:hypothetical protein
MSKRTIIQWWIWGLVAIMPAGVLIPSGALALAAHLDSVTRGTGFHFVSDRYSWTMVGLIVLGVAFAVAGMTAQFVAWIGAVVNTRRLADKRWFNVLLWGGIAGFATTPLFGLGTLIAGSVLMAYLVAGPDGMAADPRPTTPAKATITRWAGQGFAVAGAGLVVSLIVPHLTNYGRPLHGLVWPSMALVSVGFTAVAVGATVVYAAWWAAVFNTHLLQDKTWFTGVLWGGIAATAVMPLFGLGALILAAVMIAYGHSAPDGLALDQPQMPTQAAQKEPLATTPRGV